MSTKTTFKRVALVAVAALGFGVLTSVAPANAALPTTTHTIARLALTSAAKTVAFGESASSTFTLGASANTAATNNAAVSVAVTTKPTGSLVTVTSNDGVGTTKIASGTDAAATLTSSTVGTNAARKVLKPYGVDIHSLRHTYAYLLKQQGVHVTTAQRLLGHSDPRVTMGIYTQVLDNEIDDVGLLLAKAAGF
jgi:hypothetical protein